MTLLHFEGMLATSHHPLRYIAYVAIPIFTLLGAWMAIHIVQRFDVLAPRNARQLAYPGTSL